MSDKIYVGDNIPSDYRYAIFSGDYITLFNKPSARGETLSFYRIYYKYSYDTYITGSQTFSNYDTTYFTEVQTSNQFFDRPDSYKIVFNWFIIVFCCIWLFNLITSVIHKGGVLGGLV